MHANTNCGRAAAWHRRLFVAALLPAGVVTGLGYNLQTDPVWQPGDVVVMNLRLGTPSNGGFNDGSVSWNDPAEAALLEWNPYLGRVRLSAVREGSAAIANGNGVNTVSFSSTAYGDPWASRIVAYCWWWYRNGRRIEADVLFNSTVNWNSYRGNLRSGAYDLRRVALHEFGHAIGLNHPDAIGQSVDAIMVSVTGDRETLAADDIAGARALYGTYAAPSISSQPQAQTVLAGGTANFSVVAAGTAPLRYQWRRNGANIAGTEATLTLTNLQASHAGSYTVVVSNSVGSLTSDAAVLTIGNKSRLVNIATRAYCSTGNNITIGGFVVTGSGTKRVLVRAVGPTLTSQGIGANEVLADPMVEVHDALHNQAIVASNDNWGDAPNAAEITTVARAIGANALSASDTRSAALLVTLQPGVYTFITKGAGNTSGIVLLEVYDAETSNLSITFVNIATRAYATTGNGIAIGGFVIAGNQSKRVLLRGVGPTLTTQGLAGGEILADPTIQLYQGGTMLAQNDNWRTNANATEIASVAARIGAFAFDAADAHSAALLLTCAPGVYTFFAQGNAGSSGIVLVEVYDAD